MKSIYFLILAIAFPIMMQAGNLDNEFKKIIEKYDVAEECRGKKYSSGAECISDFLKHNQAYQKFNEDMQKNRGAEKAADKNFRLLPSFYPEYDESVITELQPMCDSILLKMDLKNVDPNISLHILCYEEINAFCAKKDNSFGLGIYAGLLCAKGMDYETVIAAVAHEMSHAFLRHQIRHSYNAAKRKRRNQVLEGVAGVLDVTNTISDIWAAGNMGSVSIDIPDGYLNVKRTSEEDLKKFHYQYAREQELEADLMAFRYLEAMGYGGEIYLKLLKILMSHEDALWIQTDNDFDHPTTSYRIGLIEYAMSHPEVVNKKNSKLQKERLREAKLRSRDTVLWPEYE